MSFIHQAKINDVNYDIIGSCYYGTSATAAGTAAKVATVSNADGFVLVPGVQVAIKFTTANSASSPTLNVNSTGAKTMKYRGAAITSSTYYWGANQVVTFIYDGEAWQTTDYLKNPNSDTKVTTTLSTSETYNGNYPFILKNTTTVTDSPTTGLRYSSKILANPHTGTITAEAIDINELSAETITANEINTDTLGVTDSITLTNDSSSVTIGTQDDQLLISGGIILKNAVKLTNIGTQGLMIGTNVAVNTSGAMGSRTAPVYVSDGHGTLSACTNYAGATNVTLNGSNKGGSTASFYAPTSAGTKDYVLVSNGSGAPVWADASTLNTGSTPQKITLVATAGQTAFTIPFEYDSLSSNLTVYFNGILMKETDNYTVNTSNNTVNLAGFSAEAGDVVTIMGLLGAQSIDFGQEAIDAINQINATVAQAKQEIDLKLEEIEDFINELPDDTTKLMAKNTNNTMESGYKITMASNYTPSGNYDVATKLYVDNKTSGMATQTYVNNQISTATASIVTDVFATGTTSPDNGYSGDEATKRRKLLWIDTGTSDPGLKYYNGSKWATVPVRWS